MMCLCSWHEKQNEAITDMKNFAKQLFSFILPFTVLVIVPRWIEDNWTLDTLPHVVVGILSACFGLTCMVFTISSFITIGKGTLAPWAPTKKLVVTGLYRYMRNPMISGVFMVLLGETLCLWSTNLLAWSGAFFLINTIYFILSEEPGLEKRFGSEYREYKSHVPRWIPRLTPYDANLETK